MRADRCSIDQASRKLRSRVSSFGLSEQHRSHVPARASTDHVSNNGKIPTSAFCSRFDDRTLRTRVCLSCIWSCALQCVHQSQCRCSSNAAIRSRTDLTAEPIVHTQSFHLDCSQHETPASEATTAPGQPRPGHAAQNSRPRPLFDPHDTGGVAQAAATRWEGGANMAHWRLSGQRAS